MKDYNTLSAQEIADQALSDLLAIEAANDMDIIADYWDEVMNHED